MDAVSHDHALRSLADDAFRSSVRAYAAHPAALKDVFHVKKLHLGHVAHSFALRSDPNEVVDGASGIERDQLCIVLSLDRAWLSSALLTCLHKSFKHALPSRADLIVEFALLLQRLICLIWSSNMRESS